MSTDNSTGSADTSDVPTLLELLVDDATRQLRICNACRYCEGFCAVFPALERRAALDTSALSQLANLCHDCRACYDACMYSPPHEFRVNVPATLTAVRLADYRRYVWPTRVPRLLVGWSGMFVGAVVSSAVMLLIAVTHAGWSGIVATHDRAQSPYELIPYPALMGLMLAAGAFAVAVSMAAARLYLLATASDGPPVRMGNVARASWHALTLRYMRGGGSECYYPDDDKPSRSRRYLHTLVVAGFTLCVLSTVAAGILQDVIGDQPPYPWLSVPVISGTAGGVGLLVGCVALLVLKARGSGANSVAQMTVKDYGLLTALAFLALSGLATLLSRSTAAFGYILLIHLSAVVLAFACAPYSKFIHVIFRFAALVRDDAERRYQT